MTFFNGKKLLLASVVLALSIGSMQAQMRSDQLNKFYQNAFSVVLPFGQQCDALVKNLQVGPPLQTLLQQLRGRGQGLVVQDAISVIMPLLNQDIGQIKNVIQMGSSVQQGVQSMIQQAKLTPQVMLVMQPVLDTQSQLLGGLNNLLNVENQMINMLQNSDPKQSITDLLGGVLQQNNNAAGVVKDFQQRLSQFESSVANIKQASMPSQQGQQQGPAQSQPSQQGPAQNLDQQKAIATLSQLLPQLSQQVQQAQQALQVLQNLGH